MFKWLGIALLGSVLALVGATLGPAATAPLASLDLAAAQRMSVSTSPQSTSENEGPPTAGVPEYPARERDEQPARSTGPGVPLFDFAGEEPAWYTVDDDVMGGRSRSSVTVDENSQRLIFSGDMSLENNGGFASSRSQWAPYDLSAFDGIALRVRGDGNVYRLSVRTEAAGPGVGYTAVFETQADTWQEVYVPFDSMVPLYRGFLVRAAGPLDAASVRSFGLMLSDKQEGAFQLEVAWINAVAENRRQITPIRYNTP